ncbi:MAG: hypothetical protein NTY10_00845, partial [Candidatus Omnitrophica bacterium]|nr:hypothetical protein [Candidatus Omnitrophota bacterium]
EKGRQEIKTVEEKTEQDLIYPAIGGRDIKRWHAEHKTFMLLAQDTKTRRGYSEEFFKANYPRTYGYLLQFKDVLLKRPLYKKFHEEVAAPFYSQFNISTDTFSLYKVVWKAIADDIYATVISQVKTDIGFKTLIPIQTVAFFYSDNESEAHYLCAIINSRPTRDFIKSFSPAVGGRLGTPSVMEHIAIPKFNPKNELHRKLSEISQRCHQFKIEGKEKKIEGLEKENDGLVEDLFKLVE